jgi:hypothetical protein
MEDGAVERARALVRAAAALRGWLLAPTAEADEVHDPYGAPLPFFRSIGDEIHQALDPVVTALTGVAARASPGRGPTQASGDGTGRWAGGFTGPSVTALRRHSAPETPGLVHPRP